MSTTSSRRHRRSQRALIDHLEKRVAEAYAESVRNLRDGVNVSEVADALKRGDAHAAVNALNIEEAAFAPLRRALEEAYIAGGNLSASLIPWRKRRGA